MDVVVWYRIGGLFITEFLEWIGDEVVEFENN